MKFVIMVLIMAFGLAGCGPEQTKSRPKAFETDMTIRVVAKDLATLGDIHYGYTIDGQDYTFTIDGEKYPGGWEITKRIAEPTEVWVVGYSSGKISCGIRMYYDWLVSQIEVDNEAACRYDMYEDAIK